jgi:hypothetical protein
MRLKILDIFLSASIAFGVATTSPVGAQTVDNPDTPSGAPENYGSENNQIALNEMFTRKIVRDLKAVTSECGRYDDVYRIDCMRQGIDMIVASLPEHSEYDRAQSILRDASRKLGNIVARYADKKAPKLVPAPNANPRYKKARSYRAIKKIAVPDAFAEATKVIEEAKTRLLRSSENSERRCALPGNIGRRRFHQGSVALALRPVGPALSQKPIEAVAPVGHAHGGPVRTGLEQHEAGWIALPDQALVESDLGFGRIDAVARSMTEKDRQAGGMGGARGKIRVADPSHDHHSGQRLHHLRPLGRAPADDAAHRCTG